MRLDILHTLVNRDLVPKITTDDMEIFMTNEVINQTHVLEWLTGSPDNSENIVSLSEK